MSYGDELRRLADEQAARLEAFLAEHPGPAPELLEELAERAAAAAERLLAEQTNGAE